MAMVWILESQLQCWQAERVWLGSPGPLSDNFMHQNPDEPRYQNMQGQLRPSSSPPSCSDSPAAPKPPHPDWNRGLQDCAGAAVQSDIDYVNMTLIQHRFR